MTTSSRTGHYESCARKVPVVLEKGSLCPGHYLEEAFGKLALATEHFHRGQDVDYRTLDWLLAQMDFVVESLAEKSATWNSDQRSELLELLLGVSHLNEYVRHSTVLTRHSS